MPIYIADDDPAGLSALQFLLESEGYTVAAFRSGAALLSAFPGPVPSCVVLDCVMPGLNGLEVARHLRDLGINAPVVLTTGHPSPAIRGRARAAGLPLIEKPLSQDLLAAIEAARTGAGPAPGEARSPE
ncbi:response regulator transcription factor [Methylobacterium isbiliense]|uniref:Response regulator protein TodT n=1 Tax=Methylobacterium isbiliense TaxID=315478 RepID=A0ABQ4SRB5_9HYPH|nr:response regulator [Methylobacterium isbiliense]MDN3625940.1 response regulator [Methylobacterium isbiliense]GJE04206.1 Response regulator protein TodT [Methylobacterium isbiliense]